MRYFYLIYLLIVCCSQNVYGTTYYSASDCTPFIHEYVGQYIYEGDSNGDFKGDFAVTLDDGSSWKIHPDHKELFIDWNIGDKVHIELRESSYYFKREHKFILFNHQKNQGLYVMLIDTPFIVDVAEEPMPTARFVNWPYTYTDYKQNLILSDGSRWEIDSYIYNRFSNNTSVYVGYNPSNKDFLDPKYTWNSFFIIRGKGKEAKWEWASPGNYKYYFY